MAAKSSKPASRKKTASKSTKSPTKSKKPKFTVQQLNDINDALTANPKTKSLAHQVFVALHDPGVTVPPLT